MKAQNRLPDEHIQISNAVVNFILNHLSENIDLKRLANIANYSPFHFQKIFRQVTGETPKQYLIRMRLENSAHFIVNHERKSITDIALESGFASPSTFARAFKNHFGISADTLRRLGTEEKLTFRRSANKGTNVYRLNNGYDLHNWEENLKVKVNKVPLLRLLFINAPLSDSTQIQKAFQKILRLAAEFKLLNNSSKFIGVINPHAKLYQAGITIHPDCSPKYADITDLQSGKFATIKIKGDPTKTFHCLHALNQLWMANNGYRVKHAYVFEMLAESPLKKLYQEIEREVFVPIEAASERP
jgi:AraC family transcriptional regulator